MSNDIRLDLGLRPVINVSGTMTALGSSIVVPQAIEAVSQSLNQFFEMGELYKQASKVIADLTGAEAGLVTASCASGIAQAVAGAITGQDLLAIERLPDTGSLKNEVVTLSGHMVGFGAPVEQMIRLTGAKVVPVGQATSASAYQLAASITDKTAAAVFVVSHHVVDYGQIPIKLFINICHEKGVPVIVDAASEYDMTTILALGADIVIWSGHKFLGGPTSGIVAGRKNLVRAAYLQNRGIGRAMKVGKESIVGVIAAMTAWKSRDHDGIRARERAALEVWSQALDGKPGVTATIVPDPTNNPLERMKIAIDPQQTHISAWDLAARLAAGDRPVIVRDHEVEHGHFFLDPCNLHPGQEFMVAERLTEELDKAALANDIIEMPIEEVWLAREASILNWPD
ncbi:aminotransferase class V-fold PLP-dependent enzyme [Devosia rhodophyticola]|uniref:Aminotransferase class V-fold PLP-dependent enzyme n=1 Tax=Devosia rhodophyticola TaxID=3026423 RepID=A0ABY7Z1J8_9HYPH|nr:aminotransferase class V-fold PLP-dependent enzyme [Devosia rhodophyticola]WDR07432.1 aminotransferase class V-fold PLP-dependent enzyme [Devosia rhodophyticola]